MWKEHLGGQLQLTRTGFCPGPRGAIFMSVDMFKSISERGPMVFYILCQCCDSLARGICSSFLSDTSGPLWSEACLIKLCILAARCGRQLLDALLEARALGGWANAHVCRDSTQ